MLRGKKSESSAGPIEVSMMGLVHGHVGDLEDCESARRYVKRLCTRLRRPRQRRGSGGSGGRSLEFNGTGFSQIPRIRVRSKKCPKMRPKRLGIEA